MNTFIKLGRFSFVEMLTNDIKTGMIGTPFYFKGLRQHPPRPATPRTQEKIPILFFEEKQIRDWVLREFPQYGNLDEIRIRGIERYYKHPVDFWVERYVTLKEEGKEASQIQNQIKEEASAEAQKYLFEQFVQSEQAGDLGVPWVEEKSRLKAIFQPGEEHVEAQRRRVKYYRGEILRQSARNVLGLEDPIPLESAKSVEEEGVGEEGGVVVEEAELAQGNPGLEEEASSLLQGQEGRRSVVQEGVVGERPEPGTMSPFDIPIGMSQSEFEDVLKDYPQFMKYCNFYDSKNPGGFSPFMLQMYSAGNHTNPFEWPEQLQSQLVDEVIESQTFTEAQQKFEEINEIATNLRREKPELFTNSPSDASLHPTSRPNETEIAQLFARSIKSKEYDGTSLDHPAAGDLGTIYDLPRKESSKIVNPLLKKGEEDLLSGRMVFEKEIVADEFEQKMGDPYKLTPVEDDEEGGMEQDDEEHHHQAGERDDSDEDPFEDQPGKKADGVTFEYDEDDEDDLWWREGDRKPTGEIADELWDSYKEDLQKSRLEEEDQLEESYDVYQTQHFADGSFKQPEKGEPVDLSWFATEGENKEKSPKETREAFRAIMDDSLEGISIDKMVGEEMEKLGMIPGEGKEAGEQEDFDDKLKIFRVEKDDEDDDDESEEEEDDMEDVEAREADYESLEGDHEVEQHDDRQDSDDDEFDEDEQYEHIMRAGIDRVLEEEEIDNDEGIFGLKISSPQDRDDSLEGEDMAELIDFGLKAHKSATKIKDAWEGEHDEEDGEAEVQEETDDEAEDEAEDEEAEKRQQELESEMVRFETELEENARKQGRIPSKEFLEDETLVQLDQFLEKYKPRDLKGYSDFVRKFKAEGGNIEKLDEYANKLGEMADRKELSQFLFGVDSVGEEAGEEEDVFGDQFDSEVDPFEVSESQLSQIFADKEDLQWIEEEGMDDLEGEEEEVESVELGSLQETDRLLERRRARSQEKYRKRLLEKIKKERGDDW